MDLLTLLRVFQIIRALRGHERWTHPQLMAYQHKRLQQLREYAYDYSPFYQRFHRGLFNHSLQDLPMLTKSLMMENFDELVTDRSLHLDAIRAFSENQKQEIDPSPIHQSFPSSEIS